MSATLPAAAPCDAATHCQRLAPLPCAYLQQLVYRAAGAGKANEPAAPADDPQGAALPPHAVARCAIPLYRTADLRALENRAAAHLPPHTLMARAGAAAARFLLERLCYPASSHETSDTAPQKPTSVLIVAGPGNNGGDGLVLASELHRAGIAVEVCLPVESQAADAHWALTAARAAGVRIHLAAAPSFSNDTWLVDALFGIGLARPLEGIFADWAQRFSAHTAAGGCVLALDLPSGLEGDTGCIVAGGPGEGRAVRASHTLTFLGVKPGLWMGAGRDCAGEIWFCDLGVADDMPTTDLPHLNAPDRFVPHLPRRVHTAHKGSHGSCAVVGGGQGMVGALLLCARTALLSGAGKVHGVSVGRRAPIVDFQYPELMLHAAETDEGPALFPYTAMDALVIGPGLGQSAASHTLFAQIVQTLARADMPTDAPADARIAERSCTTVFPTLLLDADALNLLAQDSTLAALLATLPGPPRVLTPHPLEAARLLQCTVAEVQSDRLAAAYALAARFRAVVVLKGSGTVIAAPAEGAFHAEAGAINPTGNAALATGGSGDVLSGLLGALLAQRMPPCEAARAAVWLHGCAAELLCLQGHGPIGCNAGLLAPTLRRLLNRFAEYTWPASPHPVGMRDSRLGSAAWRGLWGGSG